MLTKQDLNQIQKLIKDEIKYLPSKDEFYDKMDEVMGELKSIREELILITGRQAEHSDQLDNHEERITKLEKHGKIPSPITA